MSAEVIIIGVIAIYGAVMATKNHIQNKKEGKIETDRILDSKGIEIYKRSDR